MFSFFKNWFQKDVEELRSLDEIKRGLAEDAGELFSEQERVNSIRNAVVKKVGTELSLHPGWEERLDGEKKYTLRFLEADLPQMNEGTVGVAGFSLIPEEEGITVALFFRNATEHPARFQNVTLSVSLDDRPFAKQQFDLSMLGAVPPHTSRPWEVFFPKSSFLDDNFTFSRWKVSMDLGKRTHVWPKHLDLDPEMEARMTERQKEKLEYIVDALPSLNPNQVEAVGFDAGTSKDGSLVISVLFRNATEHEYAPEKLKLRVTDAVGDVVASGTLDTSKLRVKARTSRPWIVLFPSNVVKKPGADLSEWKLHLID